MKTQNFDLGIYSFHRTVRGGICVDDDKVNDSTVFGVLHPTQTVDPQNIYCYAIDTTGEVKQLVKKNLRFRKVLTLKYSREESEVDLHARLNAAHAFLCGSKQTVIGQQV